MSNLWLNGGNLVVDGSNQPILCNTCPCGGGGIVVTVLGGVTGSGKSSIAMAVIATPGDLVVMCATQAGLLAGGTALYNGSPMTLAKTQNSGAGAIKSSIYYAVDSVGGGTITYNGPIGASKAFSVVSITGLASKVVDIAVSSTGNSNSPLTSGTLTFPGVSIGMVGTSESDSAPDGSWVPPFAELQDIYQIGIAAARVCSGYYTSFPGSTAAAKVGKNTTNWNALMVNFI